MELSISRMQQLQQEQYEVHKDTWAPRTPEHGRDHILFMIEEIGETIAILKKKGNDAVLSDPVVRAAFLEELTDVLMYYMDILLCFQITPEELSQAYMEKHIKNTHRNYTKEYKELYTDG